ncbi:MAG: hypothetical protein ACRCYR_19505 [Phycicoccus sp.]
MTSNTRSEQSVDTTWPSTTASHCEPVPLACEFDWLLLDPGTGAGSGAGAGAASSVVELDESWLELEEPSSDPDES